MDAIGKTPAIHPRPTLGRRLDATARAGFPAICTIFLMLLTLTPFGFADQAQLLPAITLTCVWFWSLYRPLQMPALLVFAIGLLLDLLGYLPLGVGVLTLLATHGIAFRLRRVLVKQSFLVVWLVFVLVAAGGAALMWALSCVLFYRLLVPAPAVFQAVLTIALYPAIAILFVRAHRTVADPARA
jgi:rod shape-determining protein MreD